jgi:hypothetical protein
MGPRQYKQRTYSTKPCDDVTGPGPPIFQKKTTHKKLLTQL